MKRTLLSLVACIALAQTGQAAAIAFQAGVLSDANGVALPDGTLIQVIASTGDSAFSAPLPGSFIGSSADDVILYSFLLDSTGVGEPGTFATLTGDSIARPALAALNYTPGAYNGKTIVGGTPILLRWWPSKNLSSLVSVNDRYGEFRSDSILEQSATRNWTIPPNGPTDSISFLSQSMGGSSPNTAGRASLTVVPEPSSAVLAVAGGLAMLVRRRRK